MFKKSCNRKGGIEFLPLDMRLALSLFPFPNHEPSEGGDDSGCAYAVGQRVRQLEALRGDADVGYADAGHEERWDKGDNVGSLLLHQVDGDGPEGEDREGLVTPSEVAPDNLKTICISQAIDERGGSDEK